MAFYIMKRDPSYAAGAHCISMANTRAQAERKARGMDGTINDRPAGRTYVLSESEHDDWHKHNVMPLYAD
jgi:hypothetical protein